MSRQVVVGGSIAGLVAADRLAADGVEVDLFVPERGLGGGFVGPRFGGRRVEVGSRLIELMYGGDEPPTVPSLDDYRPGSHGHRPYLPLVRELVHGLAPQGLVDVAPALVDVNGTRYRDWILDGRLSGLVQLIEQDPVTRESVVQATRSAVDHWGDRGWFRDPRRLATATFYDADVAHLGREFHERFTEPFASRILEGGSSSVCADLHRKIWLPLFWPGSVHAALTHESVDHPVRPMHTVAGGGMSALVERLVGRVVDHPLVTGHRHGAMVGLRSDGGDVALGFADGTSVTAHRPILATSAEELFRSAGLDYGPDKVVSSLAWLALPEGAVVPDTMWLLEADRPVFRMTRNQADDGAPIVCCELAWWVDPAETEAVARRELVRCGIIERPEDATQLSSICVGSFARPSADNRAAFASAQTALDDRAVSALIVGAGAAFGADHFNEQVIQGLAAAKRVQR